MSHTFPHKSIWSDLQGVAFDQGFVNAGSVRTRYLHAGKKGMPALIFLHGTGGHAEAYVRNLEAHAEHFDVYALDLLGHGFSDKPAYDYTVPEYVKQVIGFMDAMGISKASMSGESLGGWVTSHVAVTHPDRVHKLVLNTASGDKLDAATLARIREITTAAVDDPSWERVKSRLEWLMWEKDKVHDDLVSSRQRIYAQPSMKKGIQHVLAMHTPEARAKYAITPEQWKSIKAPTLVLWTDHDPTATVETGRQLADSIPGSQFVVMDGCGHWPQFEDPATFNKIHIEFLLNG